VILFLPINVYRARYQVAGGRPYSAFERLLLEAVHTGDLTTTEGLATEFCVHERLVIEGVATLLEAGWIALGDTNLLMVTAAGKRALAEPDRLPPDLVLRDSTEWLVQERVCGQVILQDGVTYARRDDLAKEGEWQQERALPPSAEVPSSLDPGQVVPLLRIGGTAYLHWVGPVDIHRSGEDYLVVTADPETGAIANLPRAWEPALRTHLMDYARYFRERMLEREEALPDEGWTKEYHGNDEVDPGPAEWQVDAGSIRLLRSPVEHDQAMREALGAASDYVFVATTELSEAVTRPLLPLLAEALARGISMDVLWGHQADAASHKRAFDLLKKLEYDSARQGSGGRLHLNDVPSGCHANLLICAGRSEVGAAFGCHRWLGRAESDEAHNLSLRLSSPGPVAYLCRLMADFAARDRKLSAGSAPIRLPNLAAELERSLIQPFADEYDDPVRVAAERRRPKLIATRERPVVRVWLERQQRAALVRLADSARERLLIASPDLDGASALRELDLIASREDHRSGAIRLDVRYAQASWSHAQEGVVSERTVKTGGSIVREPRLRASVLVADEDTFVLSSHHWFMPFVPVAQTMSSTIGIEIEGMSATAQLLPWILPDG
jgi:hypothetical protein